MSRGARTIPRGPQIRPASDRRSRAQGADRPAAGGERSGILRRSSSRRRNGIGSGAGFPRLARLDRFRYAPSVGPPTGRRALPIPGQDPAAVASAHRVLARSSCRGGSRVPQCGRRRRGSKSARAPNRGPASVAASTHGCAPMRRTGVPGPRLPGCSCRPWPDRPGPLPAAPDPTRWYHRLVESTA